MIRTINNLQLMLFHYVFAYEVMRERAEEAEKQAGHFANLLTKVLEEASALKESLEGLCNDENPSSGEQPACASDGERR